MRDFRVWVSWAEDIKREPSAKEKELIRILALLMRILRTLHSPIDSRWNPVDSRWTLGGFFLAESSAKL